MYRVIFVTVYILVLTACGAAPSVAAVPTALPTVAPRPTPIVLQCRVESAAFLTEVQPIATEWDDTNKLAGSTPRVSLPTVITQMQGIKRRVDQLSVPSCAQSAQSALGQAMGQTINAYIAFLGKASDSVVQAQFKQASASMQEFQRQMTFVQTGVLPPAPTPVVEAIASPTARNPNMTADEQQYADKLQAMFGKMGDHAIDLKNVLIRQSHLSDAVTNIVEFEVTITEAVYLDQGLHKERQAWGAAVVNEVSKWYPKGPLTVEMFESHDSFTYLKDTACSFSSDTLTDTGYSHTHTFFLYLRDAAGTATTTCY